MTSSLVREMNGRVRTARARLAARDLTEGSGQGGFRRAESRAGWEQCTGNGGSVRHRHTGTKAALATPDDREAMRGSIEVDWRGGKVRPDEVKPLCVDTLVYRNGECLFSSSTLVEPTNRAKEELSSKVTRNDESEKSTLGDISGDAPSSEFQTGYVGYVGYVKSSSRVIWPDIDSIRSRCRYSKTFQILADKFHKQDMRNTHA